MFCLIKLNQINNIRAISYYVNSAMQQSMLSSWPSSTGVAAQFDLIAPLLLTQDPPVYLSPVARRKKIARNSEFAGIDY